MFAKKKSISRYLLVWVFTIATVFCATEAQGFWIELGTIVVNGTSYIISFFSKTKNVDGAIELVDNVKKLGEVATGAVNIAGAATNLTAAAVPGAPLPPVPPTPDFFDTTLGKATIAGGCLVAVGAGVYVIKIGHDIYRVYCPSEDTLKQKQQAEEQAKLVAVQLKPLVARMTLNKCLVMHESAGKDSNGMPVKCQDEIRIFLEEVGFEEYAKVRKAFLAR